MILPTKHLTQENALIGLGAVILSFIDSPKSVSNLWSAVKEHKEVGGFDRFILVLDMLYIIGAIKFDNNKIKKGY
jgi:hypothetical protein